jgi:cytochrome c peroxidase
VPRNAAIPANADPKHYDLGICGPLRTDHPPGNADQKRFCGLFKTPTLRNAATRHAFFHNGAIRSLEQAVRFYATRDSNPEIWYPTLGGTPKAASDAGFPTYGLVHAQYVGGRVQKFDDLPFEFRRNIDPQRPLDGRAAGSAPALSERQIQDLLCFLETLTDGYVPPKVPQTSGRCVD